MLHEIYCLGFGIPQTIMLFHQLVQFGEGGYFFLLRKIFQRAVSGSQGV